MPEIYPLELDFSFLAFFFNWHSFLFLLLLYFNVLHVHAEHLSLSAHFLAHASQSGWFLNFFIVLLRYFLPIFGHLSIKNVDWLLIIVRYNFEFYVFKFCDIVGYVYNKLWLRHRIMIFGIEKSRNYSLKT